MEKFDCDYRLLDIRVRSVWHRIIDGTTYSVAGIRGRLDFLYPTMQDENYQIPDYLPKDLKKYADSNYFGQLVDFSNQVLQNIISFKSSPIPFECFITGCKEIILNPEDNMEKLSVLMLLDGVAKQVNRHFLELLTMREISREADRNKAVSLFLSKKLSFFLDKKTDSLFLSILERTF